MRRLQEALAASLALALVAACDAGLSPEKRRANDGAIQAALAERDATRDRAEQREREMQAEILRLREELATLKSQQAPAPEVPVPKTPGRTTNQQVPVTVNAVDLLEVSTKATESNSSWTRFSWQARVRNNLNQPIAVRVVVQFQDSEDFVLDEDSENVVLGPGEERQVTDYDLVDAMSAPRVTKIGGKIER